jgi:hypothetical protein
VSVPDIVFLAYPIFASAFVFLSASCGDILAEKIRIATEKEESLLDCFLLAVIFWFWRDEALRHATTKYHRKKQPSKGYSCK